MKKLIVLLATLLSVCMIGLGCGPTTITLDKTTASMEVGGDTVQLTATVSDESIVTWSSSNASVVTVSDSGLLTAVSEGSAKITATAGVATAECVVTVEDNRPVTLKAEHDGSLATRIEMANHTTETIDVYLERGGSRVDDVTVSYESADDSIATVSNGVITAVGAGETFIAYSITFKGQEYLDTVTVYVTTTAVLSADNSSVTLSAIDGGDNATSVTPVITVTDGQNTVENATLSFASYDTSVATVDASTGLITAVSKGSTTVVATYDDNGQTKTCTINVTVNPVDVTIDKQILLSAYDTTDSYDIDLGTQIKGEVLSVKFANETDTYTDDELGFTKSALEKTGYYTLTVETSKANYIANAIVADKVITTKAEFANWPYYIRPTNWSRGVGAGYTDGNGTIFNVYEGLVVLGADINLNGDVYVNELMYNGDGINIGLTADNKVTTDATLIKSKLETGYGARFNGTFDGQGHAIYDVTIEHKYSSIFGALVNGTIKNVAVTQLVHKPLMATGYGSVIGKVEANAVISDIFVEGRFAYNQPATGTVRTGFVGQFTDCANVTNLVGIVTYMPFGDMSTNGTGRGYPQNTVMGYGNTPNQPNSVHVVLGGVGFTTGNAHQYDKIAEFSGQWIYKVGSTLYRNYFNRMDANLWTSTSGFPVMNSALNHLSDLDLAAFYGEEQTLSVPRAGSVVIGAVAKEGSGANKQVNYWNFEVEDIAGVTFDSTNRTLSVDATVPAGTKIKVTATNQLNTNQKVEIELEVILPVVELDQKLFSKYDETDGTYNFDYLEGDIVSLSLVDDATQDGYNYESSSVAVGDIPVGYYSVSVETATKIYKFKAIFADKVVTTAEEFANWPQYIRPDNWSWGAGLDSNRPGANISQNTYTGLVVLGADINMNGAEYVNELFKNMDGLTIGLNSDYQFTTNEEEMAIHPAHPNWGKMKFDGGYCAEFAGTFDGLGHTVYNFHVDKAYAGIFGFRVASSGVVKNLGVTQVTLNYPGDGSNANFKYQGTTLAGYMWGRASNIFIEGAMNFANAGQTRNSLGFGDVQDGNKLDGSIYTPYIENVIAVVTYSPSGQKGDWGNSRVTAMCYGAPDAGVVLGLASGDTVSAIGDGTVLNSTISAYAGKNFSMLDSNLWDVSSGFPVFKSAIGKLSTLNLEAVNASSEKVTTVSAEETVTIQSVALSASGVNSQMNYWTFEVDGNATLDLTDVLNGVKLTVNAGVASGTVITVTATNQLDTNQKVTLTLTVA